MKCWLVICFSISISGIVADIQSAAKSYFNSDIARTFATKWKPYGQMYETTLGFTLQEGFGHNSMNVYINRFLDPLTLSLGYYHSDNQVKFVCQAVILEALPHLYDIEISFPLHTHLLQIEAGVGKMILHTNYVLFRNKSDIIFVPEKQDTLASSPFRFQQVRNIGALAITVEGCSLYGSIVTTLSGNTVNLGHHDLKLKECQYDIEIYQLNNGAPPVIASYLPTGEKGLNLDDLLMQPIIAELTPKLQAAMFSEINTSSIFDEDLAKIRSKQLEVFDETMSCLDDIVRSMNQKTLEKNMGTVELNDFAIVWDDPFTEIPLAKAVSLTKMVLIGLDSVYASHSGGPIKLTELEILDQLRFGTLQVVGTITVEGFAEANEFAAEISDFAFDVSIDASNQIKFDPRGWRYIEFSCPAMEFVAVESFVVGFLLKELPERLKAHLISVYSGGAVNLHANVDDDETDESGSYDHEETIDGKHFAETHEILDQNKDQYTHVDYGMKQSNDKSSADTIKINIVKKKLDKYNNYNEMKLNVVAEEPQDEVNMHQVSAEDEVEDQGQVKLNHIYVVPEVEDNDPVKVHHVSIEAEPEDQGPVKVNHGGIERAGSLKKRQNHTALRNSRTKTVVSNTTSKKFRTNATSANRTLSDERTIKASKVGRNKVPIKEKKQHAAKKVNVTRIVKMQMSDNATALHMSDNEIHSS